MEPMEVDGGWPVPKKGDYLCSTPKGSGFINYDKRNGIIYKMLNTKPKLGERNFKCLTDGCPVKVKTDYENKVINVVLPKKNKDLQFLPPVLPLHRHDNNAKEIKMIEIVHAEMQHGLQTYMNNGYRMVISAINDKCGDDTELLAFRPTDQELKFRWHRAFTKYLQVSFRCL